MRRQSWCLVMAANQNSGIDVFFGAEFNFRVQIPNFWQAHHYKVSKNHFSGCQHQKVLFTRAWLRYVLKACFTCTHRLRLGCVVYTSKQEQDCQNAGLQNIARHAFKTNKKIQLKIDLPPHLRAYSNWLKPLKLKLVLHGVAQKFEQKKFISFFEILKHCLAEYPTFRQYHWIEQQKLRQFLKFCSWP